MSTQTYTAQKQLDPEESDNKDEVDLPSDDSAIRKKEHRNNSIQKNQIMKSKQKVMISSLQVQNWIFMKTLIFVLCN